MKENAFDMKGRVRNERIRLADSGDISTIVKICRYWDRTLFHSKRNWTVKSVVQEINTKNADVIVAVEKEQVIGFAIINYSDVIAHIGLLMIDHQHMRKGVGTRMMEWLEKTALLYDNLIVYIETPLKNQIAQKFYLSLGYQITQQIPGFYRNGETAVKMVHYLR